MANFAFIGRGYFRNGPLLVKPREEPVTRRPQSEALIGFFVWTRVRLWASGSMCTCACVPLCVSPVCVGPERSGCVCSFSTMKSFLKPVNNVKGKQRGEVEPPNWVPVPLPRLGPQPLAWPSASQAAVHREVPSLGQGEPRRPQPGPSQPAAACHSVYFP